MASICKPRDKLSWDIRNSGGCEILWNIWKLECWLSALLGMLKFVKDLWNYDLFFITKHTDWKQESICSQSIRHRLSPVGSLCHTWQRLQGIALLKWDPNAIYHNGKLPHYNEMPHYNKTLSVLDCVDIGKYTTESLWELAQARNPWQAIRRHSKMNVRLVLR